MVPTAAPRFMRAQPHGSLDERDRFFDRPGVDLARAKIEECAHRIGVVGEHCLVFGNCLRISALRAQHLAFRPMRSWAAWRCVQGLPGQIFSTLDIGGGRIGHIIHHAARKISR
jgi:hypothetical protein